MKITSISSTPPLFLWLSSSCFWLVGKSSRLVAVTWDGCVCSVLDGSAVRSPHARSFSPPSKSEQNCKNTVRFATQLHCALVRFSPCICWQSARCRRRSGSFAAFPIGKYELNLYQHIYPRQKSKHKSWIEFPLYSAIFCVKLCVQFWDMFVVPFMVE